MTMSVSDDIGNLFQRFGGDPDHYQEVARDDDAKHAASRWPLLSALDIGHPEHVPGAGRAAPSVVAAQAARSPSGDDTATAATAATAATQAATTAATHTPTAATSGALRAPLFARAHRHASMPPAVDPARQAATRFSPPPAAGAAAGSEFDTPRNSAAIDDESRPANSVALFAKQQTFDTPAAGSTPVTSVRPAAQTPAADSILAGMFAGPPLGEPAAPHPSRDLASLFAKLAGTPRRGRPDSGGDRS
jgi:hypothetical protein